MQIPAKKPNTRVIEDNEDRRENGEYSEHDQIKQALTASRFLIVVCSPYTPRSKWVEREIELFNSLGRGYRVLVLTNAMRPMQRPKVKARLLEIRSRFADRLTMRVSLDHFTAERHEDERDRRRTVVSIAERYRRRLAPFVDQRLAPLRRALERMSPEIRQAFLAGWRVLAEEIDDVQRS